MPQVLYGIWGIFHEYESYFRINGDEEKKDRNIGKKQDLLLNTHHGWASYNKDYIPQRCQTFPLPSPRFFSHDGLSPQTPIEIEGYPK